MVNIKKKVIYGFTILSFIFLVFIYSNINPETSRFPKCPFKTITGYQCPGCGSQRALHHLLNQDLTKAFESNALLILSIPYILILLVSEYFKTKNQFLNRIYQKLYSPKAIYILLAIIISWWIFRNI